MTKTSVQLRESSTTATAATSGNQSGLYSLFTTIPPERMGLNGEYDHNGLAKRVVQALRVRFSAEDLEKLRVMQRGKVVIFLGSVASLEVLKQLVSIAHATEGAIDVETNGVRIK
ncbi:BON domain-containing protein [Cyanobacteria bacterium FACHB-63]|nr:BON domain-containing protein [Cyanobacteria bacterium FACHB-63]